jgi:hypothetical protein
MTLDPLVREHLTAVAALGLARSRHTGTSDGAPD